MLCDYLKVFPNVGVSIYGCRVSAPPPVFAINSSAFQLIKSKILKVEVSHNENNEDLITLLLLNCIFECDMMFGQLACTMCSYWVGFHFVT